MIISRTNFLQRAIHIENEKFRRGKTKIRWRSIRRRDERGRSCTMEFFSRWDVFSKRLGKGKEGA